MGFPGTHCRPRPFEILQLPIRVVMLLEADDFWRIVYMDGREYPEVPLHTWNGHSIGHYEGDTLVIEIRQIIGWESERQQRGTLTFRRRDFEFAEFICQELMLSELPEMRPGQE